MKKHFGPGFLVGLFALLGVVGCEDTGVRGLKAQIHVEPEDLCTGADTCSNGSCRGAVLDLPPQISSQSFLLNAPEHGAFVEDQLYLSSTIMGREKVKLVAIAGSEAAPMASLDDFDGRADLLLVERAIYARTVTSSTGRVSIDVMDATRPEAPMRLARQNLFGFARPPYSEPQLVIQKQLYFCLDPEGDGTHRLVKVDLTDPQNPSLPALLGEGPCRSFSETFQAGGGFAVSGSIWVRYYSETPNNAVAGFTIYDLQGGGEISLMDHGFNTQGVSRYGSIKSLKNDGAKVLVDLENPLRFFAIDVESRPPRFVPIQFSVPAEATLLALFGGRAYFAGRDGIRAFDLSDFEHPALLPYFAPLELGPTLPRLLAVNADFLVITDPHQRLWLVPSSGPRTVTPIEVKGQGSLLGLTAQATGLVGHSSRTLVHFDPGYLESPTVAAAPDIGALFLSRSVAIDGPDEPAGVFSPPILDQPSLGCALSRLACRTSMALSRDQEPLERFDLRFDGSAAKGGELTIRWAFSLDRLWARSIKGCDGAALASGPAGVQLVSLERCSSSGELIFVGTRSLAGESLLVPENGHLSRHSSDRVSVLFETEARLFDLSLPEAPALLASASLAERILAAAHRGETWVLLTGEGQEPAELSIFTISPSGARFLRSIPIPAQLIPTSLEVDLRFAYLGLEEPQSSALWVYDLRSLDPSPHFRVPLPTAPLEVLPFADRLVIARSDGVTLTTPPCAP